MDFKLGSMLSAVDKYVPGASTKVKVLADKAKAFMDNRTELELKVLEATNHEPWGPHGTVMKEITNAAFQSEGFQQIMGILDQRLMERNENWRLCYKALLLLEFMIKHGPMRVAEACSSMRMSELDRLAHNFEWKDPATQRDEGVNVRQRARDIVGLLTDDRRLQEEREKAKQNQNKYKGMSSGSVGYGGGGGSYSSNSSSYDNYGGSSGRSGGFGNSSSFSSRREAGGAAGAALSSPPSISPRTDPTPPAAGLAGVPEDSTLDPVEATRRRIAALKAQGALPDGGSGVGSGGGVLEEGGAGLDSPKRAKKKLSDVRVNPAISAALGKPGFLSPPLPGAASAAGKPAAAAAPSAFDLLGDLEGPAPAAPAAAAGAKGGDDDWDAFTAAPSTTSSTAAARPAAAPVAAASSDWAAFTAAPGAPAAAPAKRGPLDLDDLLGGPAPSAGGQSATFAAAPAAAPTTAADPFGDPFAPVKQPAAAAPFAGAGDPFAASTTLTPGLAPHHQSGAKGSAGGAPKLGPETAKAKDPFADLAVL